MSRTHRRTAAALLALLALAAATTAAPAPSSPSSLALVPASAPMVLHFRGAEGAKDRLVTLVKNALPEFAPVVEGYLDRTTKDALGEGRKLAGLAKDGPVFAAFLEI